MRSIGLAECQLLTNSPGRSTVLLTSFRVRNVRGSHEARDELGAQITEYRREVTRSALRTTSAANKTTHAPAEL